MAGASGRDTVGGMRELPVIEGVPHATCVRRVPIFSHLTPEQQDLVGTFAHPVRLAAGELLHGAGDAVGQLFVVHTGAVKLVHTAASGRTHLVRVAGPGEVVGERAFLTGEPPEHAVEAAAETRLCTFDHRELARLVAAYPAISVGIMRSLSERLADAERRLALSAVDVPARVAAFLLELPGEFVPGEFASGDRAPGAGTQRVRLPWPKKDVASWLATTPESFSRALARLQRQGLIDVDGDTITVPDAAALEERASG